MHRASQLETRRSPRQERSKSTVEAIYQAALQILQASETESPPVQSIADRAGISIGSLYQYFSSKDALTSALLRLYLNQRLEVFEADLGNLHGASAETVARKLIDGFVDGMAARSKVERAMVRLFCRVGDLTALTQVDERMNAALERFLLSLGPEIRPVRADIAAFLIANLLRTSVLLTLLQSPDRLQDPAFKTELSEMIVRYLRP